MFKILGRNKGILFFEKFINDHDERSKMTGF